MNSNFTWFEDLDLNGVKTFYIIEKGQEQIPQNACCWVESKEQIEDKIKFCENLQRINII